MKQFCTTAVIISLLILSCKESKQTAAESFDKIDTVSSAYSTIEEDTFAKANSFLSEDELKDDRVFTDGSIPSSWENAGITDVKGLKLFLKEAQQWVMNNDKVKLAAAIKYPFKGIKNEQELMVAFDSIFTKEVKLSFATIRFNQIFRNHDGVMLGNGKVWINQFGKEFKILAIN